MNPLRAAGQFTEGQIGKLIAPIWGPTKSALARAFAMPTPNIPPPPPPAQSPIGKRPQAGSQTSFLSAAAGLASASGGSTGKTLLGQ